MNTPLLLLPPVVNVLVTGLFAGVVLRQYLNRRHNYQLYWSVALVMAFVATLAYIFMLVLHPTSVVGILLFRIYYTLGGAVMPAWLGMGSIALVCKPRITHLIFNGLCIASILAAVLILSASINLSMLSQIAGKPGTGTLVPGAWLIATILLNTLGVVAVVGVALYSGWRLLRRQANVGEMRTLQVLWANVLILIGALLDATAGSLARFMGVENTFWLVMAVGWIVLFMGVLLASRRASVSRSSQAQVELRQAGKVS